jgi:hypothetical protein
MRFVTSPHELGPSPGDYENCVSLQGDGKVRTKASASASSVAWLVG